MESASLDQPYAYPLLIKQLLHTPLVHAPDQEIVYRDKVRLTYRQLNERIHRLANGLEKLGVKLNVRMVDPALFQKRLEQFDFDMTVTRTAEHPRITKPFSDESWAALDALGELAAVPITSGGATAVVLWDRTAQAAAAMPPSSSLVRVHRAPLASSGE